MQWIATNLQKPDYDYTASVQKRSGKGITVTVEDPQNLLGNHGESTFDFAHGKMATMIVTASKCDNHPTCFTTCTECTKKKLFWDRRVNRCKKVTSGFMSAQTCTACKKCKSWYDNEIKDTRWLTEVNQQFPCPCRAQNKGIGIDALSSTSNVKWGFDFSCLKEGLPQCLDSEKGEYGCILSEVCIFFFFYSAFYRCS